MVISRPQPISILLVATTSAALHGGAAVIGVPILSFILLCLDRTPAYSKEIMQTETGMVLALVAPVVASVVGFVAGAFMAFAHNAFVNCHRETAVEISESGKAQAASLGNAA
jgi:hypothetical protein